MPHLRIVGPPSRPYATRRPVAEKLSLRIVDADAGELRRVAQVMDRAGLATAFEFEVLTIEGTTDQLSSVATENSGLAPAWGGRLQTALSSYFGMDGGIQAGGHALNVAGRVYIVGILNATPDSFSDGGRRFDLETNLDRAREMVETGADVIEVGGMTAQPSSPLISVDEEIDRSDSLIRRLSTELSTPIAVDAYRLPVVEAALEAGAVMVNDISGLADPAVARAVAGRGAALVLMHIKNPPKVDFHQDEHKWSLNYADIMDDIGEFFAEKIEVAMGQGLSTDGIILDPGLGFDKLSFHDLEVMRRIGELRSFGLSLFCATSRKNYLGELTNTPVTDLDPASAAAALWQVFHGARFVRVHDVALMEPMVRAAELFQGPREAPQAR